MFKKILMLIFLLSLSGCSTFTNANPSVLTIEGRVLVNDKLNNEDFIVQVYKSDNNESVVNSTLDPNGKFEVNITEDGEYMMTAVNSNGNDYKSNKIRFTINENKLTSDVDFTLIITDDLAELTSSISSKSATLIKGTVEFPSGMNYVDIKVMLSNEEGAKPVKVFMIDKTGEFEISDVSDGTYYICAQGPNNKASKWLEVTVADNKVVGEEKYILELK